MGSYPKPFGGTPGQRARNFQSHHWSYSDPEEAPECNHCAARTYHVAASYPCGTEPPRIETDDQAELQRAADGTALRASAWAASRKT